MVGDPLTPNGSEAAIQARLTASGREVRMLDDDGLSTDRVDGCALVLVSKTVRSTKVGDRLKPVPCTVLFWEDNLQKLDMMATIDNDGSSGVSWHVVEQAVFVRADAPADLRVYLAGPRAFYVRPGDITYAPHGDLVPEATVVAELGGADRHAVVYLVERDAQLADGTPSAGRRIYFGLSDDTFDLLSPEGIRLFDAALARAFLPDDEP